MPPVTVRPFPHVALEDCGYYVRWLFDHPERSNGMDLEVAIEHVAYTGMAAAFEKVTGHPAQYIDTDLDTYWNSPDLRGIADHPAGCNADHGQAVERGGVKTHPSTWGRRTAVTSPCQGGSDVTSSS
ncbi:hypothetical protein [Nocardiopsis sp. YSL2]|uniref:hypothetical protein n=1 Tax=Nocardiopsis sp. YSL2 TaxID=2939492 RepID=UPI0026F41EBB|nr:hypothetical protein [Nocardiopsis sp. YSL2]